MSMQSQLGFSMFYKRWISEVESVLHQLMKALKSQQCSHSELEALISKAKGMYGEFYEQKWKRLEAGDQYCDNILAYFSPVWLNPLEKSKHWVTGWKPSIAFKLMETLTKRNMKGDDNIIVDEEMKKKRMREVREKVKAEEEIVEMEIERIQASLAGRSMLKLAELGNGRGDEMVEERVVKKLLYELEKVMKAADCLRWKTLEGILGILSTQQSVEFLAAACILQGASSSTTTRKKTT